MRLRSVFVFASAFLLIADVSGCGGKVYDPGDSEAGSGATAGSGGSGGSGGIGGSGGTSVGGSGGSGGTSVGGSGGAPGGSGGAPTGGSGGGPAGTGGGTGGSAGGSCWNYLPAVTECRTCINMNCCGQVIACFEDPTGFCPNAVECFEDCPMGDPLECAQMCDDGNFNVPFNEVITCGADHCPECMNPPPPPSPQCPIQTGLPECDECMNAECGYECMACVDNPDCMGLLECISNCYDQACQQECIEEYPGGLDDLLAFLGYDGCLAMNCADPCQF